MLACCQWSIFQDRPEFGKSCESSQESTQSNDRYDSERTNPYALADAHASPTAVPAVGPRLRPAAGPVRHALFRPRHHRADRLHAGPADPDPARGLGLLARTGRHFFGFIGIAWSLKPLFGLVSDFFPIFGHRRWPYWCSRRRPPRLAFFGLATGLGPAPSAVERLCLGCCC